MKDPESAELKEKSNFRFFPIFILRVMVIFVTSSHQFSMNFRDNLKNKNRKIDFLFDSKHCASFIKTGAKLRGGWSAYP